MDLSLFSLKPAPEASRYLTVTALNKSAKCALEDHFGTVWVTGEISNFVKAPSGHCYFSLKDENAQVRCAFFRNAATRCGFTLKNGQHINVKAEVTMYAPRGDYQLIIQVAEEAGLGALQRAFEALKEKCAKAGWFDESHKKAIPTLPQQIGVVTSPTGAAVRDVLRVLAQRFPSIPVIIYPSLVQGKEAPEALVAALQKANARAECDVLLLVRGGGSLEDLWAFNEEAVARAIFQAKIPIITGIGHEIDFTIADFVADQRAPTPSAAAAAAVPEVMDYQRRVQTLQQQYQRHVQHVFTKLQDYFYHLHKRLRSPIDDVHYALQKWDDLTARLTRVMPHIIIKNKMRLSPLEQSLQQNHPLNRIKMDKIRLKHTLHDLSQAMQQLLTRTQNRYEFVIKARLTKAMQQRWQQPYHRHRLLMRTLQSLSPLSTLSRGYAIVRRDQSNKVLLNAEQAKPGDTLHIRLHQGTLKSKVIS